MKKLFSTVWLILLLHIGFAQRGITALLPKDSSVVTGDTYALIVGVSSYPYIKPLQFADKDAELFRDFLLSKAGGSVKPENVSLLTNNNATSGNFQTLFQKLYTNKDLKKGDRVYIYFAGHGDAIQDLNEYYLLLYDCQPAGDANNYSASLSAIDMYHLKNRIGKLTKQGVEVVLILDACRTNELPGGYSSQVFSQNVTESKVGEIMMLATGPGEVSIESSLIGNGHGLFTYNLIDGLSGRADAEEEGGDNSGAVSLAELQDWVRRKVRTVAQKEFHTQQNPFFCCSEKDNIQIAKVDSVFLGQWLTAKNDNASYLGAIALRNVKTQRNNNGVLDTIEAALFNKFNVAVKEYHLYGSNSASAYYDSLLAKFPAADITGDAGYTLAGELISFSQKKINLYLNGKDNSNAMTLLKKEFLSHSATSFAMDNFHKDSMLINTDFFTTGLMMQKATVLLSQDDSSIITQVRPKIDFLFARSYYDDDNTNNITFSQALKFGYDALHADENAAYINHVLALIYQKNELYDSALYFERKAVALAPKWAYAYNHLGFIYYQKGNNDSAWRYYQKALAADSNYLDPYLNLSIIASEEKTGGHENKYYHKYFKLPSVATATLIKFGNTVYDMHKYQAAIWFFRQVLKIAPQSADAYFNIANSYAKLPGQANQAKLNYEIALKINPSFAEAYVNLGNIYNELNRKDSAKIYFQKALLADPKNAIASFNTGNLYFEVNQYDSALFYYKKAVDINPGYADAYYNIGFVSASSKKYDSALLYYSKAFHINSNYTSAFVNTASIYQDQNKPDSALVYFRRALVTAPGNAEIYYLTADCYLGQKQYDSALVNYNKVVALSKADSNVYYNMACIYSIKKDSTNSLYFLEEALKAGMTDKNQILTDYDLDYTRSTDGFKKLMAKYFKK